VNVYFSDEQEKDVDAADLLHFAERVLGEEGLPPTTEMAVLLVGAEQIADYNERFMGRKGPTDVLAFPVEDLAPGHIPHLTADEPPLNLGDVFLCPSEINARAVSEKLDPGDSLFLLLAHGILHLLGYDHENDEQALLMERREDELLQLIGRRQE
jgi:probable rRNA maturation factor